MIVEIFSGAFAEHVSNGTAATVTYLDAEMSGYMRLTEATREGESMQQTVSYVWDPSSQQVILRWKRIEIR